MAPSAVSVRFHANVIPAAPGITAARRLTTAAAETSLLDCGAAGIRQRPQMETGIPNLRKQRMIRLTRAFGLLAGSLMWVAGCGQATPPPTNLSLPNGGAPPIRPSPIPRGILADLTTYQPAQLQAGGSSGGAGPGAPAAVSGDTATQVRKAMSDLLSAITDGEVAIALALYNPEHVAALTEEMREPIFSTLEKVGNLKRALAEKLKDDARAEEIISEFKQAGGKTQPKPDVIDADHASVTPYLAWVLFGPTKLTPSMPMVRVNNEWKFQFDSPLTADDAKAIVEFHNKLHTALDAITDWLDATDTVDVAKLTAALTAARQGEPVQLAPGGAAAPAGGNENAGGQTPAGGANENAGAGGNDNAAAGGDNANSNGNDNGEAGSGEKPQGSP